MSDQDPALHLPAKKQKMYHSGKGMLLWLVKHSRPDIANCVRTVKSTRFLNGGIVQGTAEDNQICL